MFRFTSLFSALLGALIATGCSLDVGQDDRPLGESEAAIDELVDAYAEAAGFNGGVLVRTPDIDYLRVVGVANATPAIPLAEDSIFQLASVSKHFMAVAIMHAIERGHFGPDGLDTRVIDVIPDRLEYGYPHANLTWNGSTPTIRQLLEHTSGTAPYTRRLYPASAASTAWELIHEVNQRPMLSEPGTAWAYNNAGYTLLEVMLEIATGQSYPEYLGENILDPLGMESTGCNWTDAHWDRRAHGVFDAGSTQHDHLDYFSFVRPGPTAACGFGGINASLDDLDTFAAALRAGSIISPESFALMRTPSSVNPEWGLGTRITAIPTSETGVWIAHNGAGTTERTAMASSVDLDATVLVLSNEPASGNIATVTSGYQPDSETMLVNLMRLAAGEDPVLPDSPAPVDVSGYAGDYCVWGNRYEVRTSEPTLGVTAAENTLFIRKLRDWNPPFSGQPISAPLVFIQDNTFFQTSWARGYLTAAPPLDVNWMSFELNNGSNRTLTLYHEADYTVVAPLFKWWMFWCW